MVLPLPRSPALTELRAPASAELKALRDCGPFRPCVALGEAERELFTGRTAEMGRITSVIAGEANIVLLVGEAGVGKTSLLCAGLVPLWRSCAVLCTYIDAGAPGVPLPTTPPETAILVLDE